MLIRNITRCFLTALLLAVCAGYASAAIFVVDATSGPYTTLAAAFAAASSGGPHQIVIRAGSYSDYGLSVPSGVDQISGDDAATVIFKPPTAQIKLVDFLNLTNVNGLTIEKLTITKYRYGLTGSTVTNCTFDNLLIYNGVQGISFSGDSPSGSDGNTIQNCQIFGNDYGIVFWALVAGGSGNLIKDNTIYGNTYEGVYLTKTAAANTVHGNCFYGNKVPQGFDDMSFNPWSGNFFGDYSGSGSYLLGGGGVNWDPTPNTFDNSAHAATTIWQVNSVHTVNFDWTAAVCNPQENGLAAYSFTVNWNPNELEYQTSPKADYDPSFLGDPTQGALYTPVGGDPATGTLIFAATNYTAPGFGSGRLAFADFKAKKTGGAAITITSTYLDKNNNPLPTSNTPLGLTIQDNVKPVVQFVTPNDPVTGTHTYSDPAGTPVQLKVMIRATDNYGLAGLYYYFDGIPGWIGNFPASGLDYTTPAEVYINITVLGTEGNHVLNVFAYDGVQLSDQFDYNFKIDRTGPALTSIMLKDPSTCAPPDPEYTNDPTVNVVLVDDGTAVGGKMEFYRTGWEGPIAYNPNPTYPLPSGPSDDGSYTVYCRLYDKFGNMGNQYSDAITLNRDIPAPTGWDLAGGAAKTATPNVVGGLTNWGGTDVVLYKWSETAGDLVCGTGWLSTAVWPINVTLGGTGNRRVYFASQDKAGNISTPVYDDIELDQTPPSFTSFEVLDQTGDPCSDSWTVNVKFGWTAPDAKWVRITNGTQVVGWIDISGFISPYTYTGFIINYPTDAVCDNYNYFTGEIADDVSNIGPVANASIFVDCYAPSAGTATLSDVATGNTTFSSSKTVDVTLTGMAPDITHIRMGEASGAYGSWVDFPTSHKVQFEFASPAEAAWVKLYIQVKDCANQTSAEIYDDIVFDLTDPVINSISINAGALKTNNPNVNVAVNYTEVYPDKIMLSQDPGFALATWQAFGGASPVTVPFLLTGADGTKNVYVKIKDQIGRISTAKSDDIYLDVAPPTGSFVIVGNTSAAPGYTNTLGPVSLESIDCSADVQYMRFRNSDLSNNTGWITPPTPSWPGWNLVPGGDGLRTVQAMFKDSAGNSSSWILASIMFYGTAPSAPAAGSASGTPGGSLDLSWGAAPHAWKYIIRYTNWNDYPLYRGGQPPHPATISDGILDDVVIAPTLTHKFEGPQPDIYAISIFTMDSAGNTSVPNTDIFETNYILGDFDFDGKVEFANEFGDFASAYYRSTGQAGFEDFCDIGPTDDGTGTGYPIPNGTIDFYDLIPFGMNYDVHGAARIPGRVIDKIHAIALTAEMPEQVVAGKDYTISIISDQSSGIKGFHLVFSYDNQNLEVVNIKAGKMYDTPEKTFFFQKADGKELLMDGVIFGADARFADKEIAQITFRAKSNGVLELKDVELTIKDAEYRDIPSTFNATTIKSASPVVPTEFALLQNYPNPFNPATTIQMALPVASNYHLDIYNIVGQKVQSFSGFSEAGVVTITWDANNFSSGIYFYRMSASGFEATRKMILVK
jgi:parallel beta-helix repeat protein